MLKTGSVFVFLYGGNIPFVVSLYFASQRTPTACPCCAGSISTIGLRSFLLKVSGSNSLLSFCYTSVPVLSRLFDARGRPPRGPFPVRPPAGTRRPALAARAARAVRRQPTGSGPGPPSPALRANPFPEVTDPFCRLPLPTLFHWPEAVHLGDLMRL